MQKRVTNSNRMILAQEPLAWHTGASRTHGKPFSYHSSSSILHKWECTQPTDSAKSSGLLRAGGPERLWKGKPAHICPMLPTRNVTSPERRAGNVQRGRLVKSTHRDRKQKIQFPQECPGKTRTSFSSKQGQDSNTNYLTLSKLLRGAKVQQALIYISNDVQYVHTICTMNCILQPEPFPMGAEIQM